MMPLRVVLADDEALVRAGLRELLAHDTKTLVVGEATDGAETLDLIRSQRPDLVFLDVRMPGLGGFEVLAHLGPRQLPAVVFVTAHEAYALQAFDFHAVDYLLKPFDADRFRVALERARRRIGAGGQAADANIEPVESPTRPIAHLLLKHDGRVAVVPVGHIDWVEAADNYVRVYAAGARYRVRSSITALEAQLDPQHFARIHRSIIVNLSRVRELHPLFGGACEIRLTTGARVRLSRSYRNRFWAVLRKAQRDETAGQHG